MSPRTSTSSNGPTWHPGSRDSQPPFIYDDRGDPQPASDDDDGHVEGANYERKPRSLHRRTTSNSRERSSSRTIRPRRRRSSTTMMNSDDDRAFSDADDEHDDLLRQSRSSSAKRGSLSPVDSHHSSVAFRDFPSPPTHPGPMYPPSPTPSACTTRRISSVEAEKRQRERDEPSSWLASSGESSGPDDDDEGRRAQRRPRSLGPFERDSSEAERRRIEERLEEQKKLREARARTSPVRAPTSPSERAASFLAAVQTHQAELDGRHPVRSGDETWRRVTRALHAVDAHFSQRDPVDLGDVDEDDAGAQSDGAPERERRAQRLNAAHRERLRRGSRMHGRLRDGESLYDLEGGPLAEYFDGEGSEVERERERDGAGSSRRSGSRASSFRPRVVRGGERSSKPPASLPARAKNVRSAMTEHLIRNARLGPNDRVQENKALAWVKQHECLTAGLAVLAVALLAVAGWAIWWAAVGSRQGAYVGA